MRAFLLVPVLTLSLGCNQCFKLPQCCQEECCQPCCEGRPCPCETSQHKLAQAPAPASCPQPQQPPYSPPPVQASCPPPRVEFRAPQEVHVKAPAAKVVVNAPAQNAYASQMPPAHMMTTCAMPAQYAPAMVHAAAPQMAVFTGGYQPAPGTRARAAIGLDFIRIPFPILRLFAVPTTPEVAMVTPAPTQIMVAPQPAALASVAPQPSFVVPATTMTPAMAQPAAVAQPVAYVPAAVTPTVAQMAAYAPTAVAPTMTAAVPTTFSAMVPAAPAAQLTTLATPMMPAVTPTAPPALAVTPTSTCPPPTRSASMQEYEQLRQQLQTLETLLNQRAAQMSSQGGGCPPR